MEPVLPVMTATLGVVGVGLALRGFVLFRAAVKARIELVQETWWTGPHTLRERSGSTLLDRSDHYTAAGVSCLGVGFFTLILSFLSPI